VASAPAVLQAAADSGLDVVDLAELGSMARGGDESAVAIVSTAGTALGNAIAHLVGALDVGEIVVHGSMTVLGEPWFSAIRAEAASRSLGPFVRETRVIDGGAGEDLTLLGAAAMLLTQELGLTVHR
jgi:glucokinase